MNTEKQHPLEADLKEHLDGEVRFDAITRCTYSVDASIYEVPPLGVVLPRHRQDILNAIVIARSHNVPIIARGAATGITGGCLGSGLIIDFSKYLNAILEVDYDARYALCEPGVVQDTLNAHLAPNGMRLGPDTSTGNRATIGGMLANNAAGARSLYFGKMVDHVEEVELVLATGEVLHLRPLTKNEFAEKCALENREGIIYRQMASIRSTYTNDILTQFPHIPRRVSGYNLDELVKPWPFNLSKLITGSEGSLGIVLKAKLKICSKPKLTSLCVLHFDALLDSMRHVTEILSFAPMAVELIDAKILAMARLHPATQKKLGWLQGSPEAVLAVEFTGSSIEELDNKLHTFADQMRKKSIGCAYTHLTNPSQINDIWEVRKSGLGLLLSKRTYSRAVAFIEDLSVAPEKLVLFMEKFLAYLHKVGKEAGIYGHVGSGCMHIRPYLDLREPQERALMEKMMLDMADLLLEYGGALSGEHGDGYIRSWLNQKMFGPKLYGVFCDIKKAFDPNNLMNPGKVVHPQPVHDNLRQAPVKTVTTFLDFTPEGGFELAVDLCNGNGLCRKSEKVMCPSFQVTKDEYDTTRARAQALRSFLNDKLAVREFANHELAAVLDLCVECKGCKSECPSRVDMAKMKSEFLFHYQEKYGYRWRNRLFGHIDKFYRLAATSPALFNALQSSTLSKWMLDLWGIAPQRTLPKIAVERFSKWHRRHDFPAMSGQEVILFNDTYSEFLQPEIAKDAITILHGLGYHVIVPNWHCCGRPLISKGLLRQAEAKARSLITQLHPYAQRGCPIIGLEPSCILTIKDDFPALFGKDQYLAAQAREVSACCLTFDQFLALKLESGPLPLKLMNKPQRALFHGHCHQKALTGTADSLKVLRSLPGYEQVSEIDSGCCGMAGSFGYEKEHFDFSMRIGSLKLFPAVLKSAVDTQIIANGISCRSQIADGTGRKAWHLAQVIGQRLLKE